MGFRAWRVWTIQGTLLRSLLDPKHNELPCIWQPGINTAICKFNADDDAPEPDCRCGFRGQPCADELVEWLYDRKGMDAPVIGGVELSGRILMGDIAHPEIPMIQRAEFATVCGPLILPRHYSAAGANLAKAYDVEVRFTDGEIGQHWMRRIPYEDIML
jgi:hypothetical protein